MKHRFEFTSAEKQSSQKAYSWNNVKN